MENSPGFQAQSSLRAARSSFAVTVLWLALGALGHAAASNLAPLAWMPAIIAIALITLVTIDAAPMGASMLRALLLSIAALGIVASCSSGESQLSLLSLTVVTFLLFLIGRLIGSYVGGLIDQPGMLTVTAYVAAIGDVFSFAHPDGITARVLQSPRALQLLLLSIPSFDERMFEPMVGVGDIVFASMFTAGTRRSGLSASKTVWALALGMCVTALLTVLLETSLPAIPAMALCVVLAHREAWHLPRGQERRVLANLVVITLTLAGFLIAARA